MGNRRRTFTGEEKMAILRRHLVERSPISTVCDEAEITPTQFYGWQKQLFENGAAAFDRRGDDGRGRKLEQKVAALERKMAGKDGVIAEIMESHVKLKKSLGET